MKKFVIIADSNCDLEEELQKQYDIEVIPGHAVLPDNTEVLTYPKWDVFSQEDFYAALKKNPDGFKTAPSNVAEFLETFEKAAKEGCDVLCITISSALSGTCNFARQAATQAEKNYPGTVVKVVDSSRFGPGFGLMVVHASLQRESGKSLEETVEWLEDNKNRFHQGGWLDDLSFVAKKGRMTNAKAFFGTLVGIKPIGEFDKNGMTTVIGKIKGAKKGYSVVLSYIKETIDNPEEQTIFIAQSNRMAQAEKFKELIEAEIHPKEVIIKDVHMSCGINVGPGLMAAYYMGKPISDDLETERALIEKFDAETK